MPEELAGVKGAEEVVHAAADRPADHAGEDPVGFQNSATVPDLGFYAARSYSLLRPPRTALDLLLGEVRDKVVGAGRVEMPAAVGAASVVVGLVLGQD